MEFIGCQGVEVKDNSLIAALSLPAPIGMGTSLPALSVVGSGAGVLLISLLGGVARGKRQLWGSIILSIVLVIILNACSEAVEDVTPVRSNVKDDGKNIEFTVEGLQSGTNYYWKVLAVDTGTGKSAPSEVFNFTTKL